MKRCACGFEGVELWFLDLAAGRGFSDQCRRCQQAPRIQVTFHPPEPREPQNPLSERGHRVAARRFGIPFDEYMGFIRRNRKFCGRCRRWKGRRAFGTDKKQTDGRNNRCRSCVRDEKRLQKVS